MNVEIMGFIAGIVILTAQTPQIIKSIRDKRTQDISLPLYVILSIGTSLWVMYGYFVNSSAVFVMNVLLLFMVLTMVFLKLRYGMKQWPQQRV